MNNLDEYLINSIIYKNLYKELHKSKEYKSAPCIANAWIMLDVSTILNKDLHTHLNTDDSDTSKLSSLSNLYNNYYLNDKLNVKSLDQEYEDRAYEKMDDYLTDVDIFWKDLELNNLNTEDNEDTDDE